MTINYHELTSQESGLIIEKDILTVCNWAIGGEIEVEGKIVKQGKVKDIKTLLGELDYSDICDDNNDLADIAKTATPGEWWEIEGENGDAIIIIAPDGWN